MRFSDIKGNDEVKRTLTAMGETVLSKVTLPLAGRAWDTLELALGSDGTSSLALRGGGAAFSLTVDEHAALGMTETWKGTLTREGKGGPKASLRYVLTREKSSSVTLGARDTMRRQAARPPSPCAGDGAARRQHASRANPKERSRMGPSARSAP